MKGIAISTAGIKFVTKSEKPNPKAFATMILGGSPIKVAVPPKLLNNA